MGVNAAIAAMDVTTYVEYVRNYLSTVELMTYADKVRTYTIATLDLFNEDRMPRVLPDLRNYGN